MAFKQRFGFVGQALASALSVFSLDVVGIVAGYALELRFIRAFGWGHLHTPRFLAVNKLGHLFVSDKENGLLQFKTDGTLVDKLEQVRWAQGVSCDEDGNVHAYDSLSKQYVFFDAQGQWQQTFTPKDAAVEPYCHSENKGQLYVMSKGTDKNRVVHVMTIEGQVQKTLLKDGDTVHNPSQCVVGPDNRLYITCVGYVGVLEMDRNGRLVGTWPSMDSPPITPLPWSLIQPQGLVWDRGGRLIVCDEANNRLVVLSKDGMFLTSYASLKSPWGICVDDQGYIYVCESQLPCVSVFCI